MYEKFLGMVMQGTGSGRFEARILVNALMESYSISESELYEVAYILNKEKATRSIEAAFSIYADRRDNVHGVKSW